MLEIQLTFGFLKWVQFFLHLMKLEWISLYVCDVLLFYIFDINVYEKYIV